MRVVRTGLRSLLVVGVVSVGWLRVVRPRLLAWGAQGDEADAALPGDGVVPRADLVATRGVTITAPAYAVWPWIAQLGQGRGGFYSYDALENLFGCNIHSADRIVPEWQHVVPGDEVRLAPTVALTVASVEPGRSLVLTGGVPMGATGPPYDFSWAFVVRFHGEGSTRFVVRERYAYTRWWAPLLVEPVEVVSWFMHQKMLRAVRQRAEQSLRSP